MPDDLRGSHASGIAICSSCRDAVYDVKRNSASPLRLSAVCQSVCRFVFPRKFAQCFRGILHTARQGTSEHDIIESHTKHTRTRLEERDEWGPLLWACTAPSSS